MARNNLSAFLDSIDLGKPHITCPACGNNMALRDMASYRMALTDNARDELNRAVQAFRNILTTIEAELARINRFGIARPTIKETDYPHDYEIKTIYPGLKPDGTYSDSVGAEAVKELITTLDVLEFTKYFHEIPWPPHSHSPLFNNKDKNADDIKKVLINGLDKASIVGPLIDLIFDQDRVASWTDRVVDKNNEVKISGGLEDILNDICPNYSQYIKDILNNNGTAIDMSFRQSIVRTQLVLVIFLGHTSQHAVSKSQGLFNGNAPFEFPRSTYISDYARLKALLTSNLVMLFCNLSWSIEIVESMVSHQKSTQTDRPEHPGIRLETTARPQAKLAGDKSEKIKNLIKSELNKLVKFTCAGPTGKLKSENETGGDSDSIYQDTTELYCGWYPKNADTYPVVLLGSPGCGKSTVMLTGLLAFIESLGALGAKEHFDRPQDDKLYADKSKEYWTGKLPKPTAKGSRQSIHLEITQTIGESRKSGNFVFTDIPGEALAASITEDGSSSSLLGILSAAETIIFFFDMVIENSIRQTLVSQKEEIFENGSGELQENKWNRLNSAFDKIKKDREEIKTDVELSQISLLNKVIENLKMKHNVGSKDKLKDLNVICVLPKIDLFADLDEKTKENKDKHMFFNDFFEMLDKERIIYRSVFSYGEGYTGLRSSAGIACKDSEEDKVENKSKQIALDDNIIKICRKISNNALGCLMKVGEGFYHYDPDNYPEAKRLKDKIESALIESLKTSFPEDRVYFLPVCAQGQADQKQQDGSYTNDLGNPPNQKLAEFVFMLPVALSLKQHPISEGRKSTPST